MKDEYWVYILLCSDSTYYTGMTSSFEHRMRQHWEGHFDTAYTISRRPLVLQWAEFHSYPHTCRDREKQIKKWSQAKKKALIESSYDVLKAAAKKDFEPYRRFWDAERIVKEGG